MAYKKTSTPQSPFRLIVVDSTAAWSRPYIPSLATNHAVTKTSTTSNARNGNRKIVPNPSLKIIEILKIESFQEVFLLE